MAVAAHSTTQGADTHTPVWGLRPLLNSAVCVGEGGRVGGGGWPGTNRRGRLLLQQTASGKWQQEGEEQEQGQPVGGGRFKHRINSSGNWQKQKEEAEKAKQNRKREA